MARFTLLLGNFFALSVAAAAAACAPPAQEPPPAVAAAEVALATPDTTGLTFLLAPEIAPTPRREAANAALRAAMESGGYRVVTDPREDYDAELVLRVEMAGGRFDVPAPGGAPTTAQVRFSIAAVAEGTVIARAFGDFASWNETVTPNDVIPTLNTLGSSSKLAAYAYHAHVRRAQQEARARHTAARED